MLKIVSRHGFDLQPVNHPRVAVFQNNRSGNLLADLAVADDFCLRGSNDVHGFQIQMIIMFVGNQDQFRLGQFRVIRLPRYRVHMNGFACPEKNERAVPQKPDAQIPLRCCNRIEFHGRSFHLFSSAL